MLTRCQIDHQVSSSPSGDIWRHVRRNVQCNVQCGQHRRKASRGQNQATPAIKKSWRTYENILSILIHLTSALKLSVPLHKRHYGVVKESTKPNLNPIWHYVSCLSITLDNRYNRIQVQVILSPIPMSRNHKEVPSRSTARPSI